MKPSGLFKKCIAPITMLLPVATALTGSAAAALRGEMELLIGSIILIFGCVIQVAMNFSKTNREVKIHKNASIVEGIYEDHKTAIEKILFLSHEGTIASVLLALTIGLSIMAAVGTWFLIPVGLMLLMGLVITSGPWPLYRSWLGGFACLIVYGIICAGTVGFAEVMHDNPDFSHHYYQFPVWTFGLALGLLVANVVLVRQIERIDSDRQVDAPTFPLKFGKPMTVAAMIFCSLLSFATILWFVLTRHGSNLWALLIPAAIQLICSLGLSFRIQLKKPVGKIPFYDLSIWIVFFFSLFLFITALLIGDSDRSRLIYFPGYLM